MAMDSSLPLAGADNALLTKSQGLELAFRASLQTMDGICKDESSRRLRVQVLLLEEENEALHEQVATGDNRIDVLEDEKEELLARINEIEIEISKRDSEIRSQARDLANIRAELDAMSGLSSDSTKLLTEKLTLTRELATLKPELEHLRSQFEQQQTVLSEKLALQRQVSTLEAELENERRETMRKPTNQTENDEIEYLRSQLLQQSRIVAEKTALQRQVGTLEGELENEKLKTRTSMNQTQNFEIEQLKSQLHNQQLLLSEKMALQRQVSTLEVELENERKAALRRAADRTEDNGEKVQLQNELDQLRKDLIKERKEKEKVQKALEKERGEWQTRKAVLDGKLDDMKTKLQSTKEELKDVRKELTQVHNAASADITTLISEQPKAKNPRKRTASEVTTDTAFGTPDGVAGRGKRAASKKAKLEKLSFGEKSNFSITPFLNRTLSVAPDTPDEKVGEDDAREDPTDNDSSMVNLELDGSSTPSAAPRVKEIHVENGPERLVLGDIENGHINPKTARSRKSRLTNTLEKVTEEGDENTSEETKPESTSESEEKRARKHLKTKQVTIEVEPKKKKRTLGAAKTLFDEDDGETTKRPSKVSLGPTKLLRKAALGGPKESQTLSVFSPLKKDRRGARASFLS